MTMSDVSLCSACVPGTVEAQQRFIAYAAHELRTPLATQRALLELALADATTGGANWREIAEDVLGACRQQERLLEACLTLSRSLSREHRSEPVDLAAIADEALHAHDLNGLKTAVVLEPAWTLGDPDLLELFTVNLVSNAIRHNIVDGRLDVLTSTDEEHATFTISNTGAQIPVGELSHLFEPFRRTSSPRRPDGIGLGLTIVQAIADAHGATVSAQAPTSGGLRVEVTFAALN